MGTKKRVEPKSAATKTKKADKTDSDRKVERKTQGMNGRF